MCNSFIRTTFCYDRLVFTDNYTWHISPLRLLFKNYIFCVRECVCVCVCVCLVGVLPSMVEAKNRRAV